MAKGGPPGNGKSDDQARSLPSGLPSDASEDAASMA